MPWPPEARPHDAVQWPWSTRWTRGRRGSGVALAVPYSLLEGHTRGCETTLSPVGARGHCSLDLWLAEGPSQELSSVGRSPFWAAQQGPGGGSFPEGSWREAWLTMGRCYINGEGAWDQFILTGGETESRRCRGCLGTQCVGGERGLSPNLRIPLLLLLRPPGCLRDSSGQESQFLDGVGPTLTTAACSVSHGLLHGPDPGRRRP